MTSIAWNAGLAPARAGRREWIGLAILTLPCMIYAMDLTVLNLAAPHLAADLAPTNAQLLWIVDIYGFFIAGSLLTMGALGDRIGRRRLLFIGAVAFACASILAALAPTAPALIAARALLGLAAATLAPSTLSLLRNMFTDARERTVAISIWSASFAVGAAIGPVIGGALLAHFWWGSVFLINVPVMAALLLLGPVFLPEYRSDAGERIDLASAVLSLASVLLLVFAVKHFAEHGAVLVPAVAIASSFVLGLLFIRRQRASRDPFLDLDLFRCRAFSGAFAISVAAFFVNFGTFFFIAQYLQLVLDLGPAEAGLWMVPPAFGFIAGSFFAPKLTERFRVGTVIAGGFIVAALGLGLIGLTVGTGTLVPVVASGFILALGLAPILIITADVIVGTAPPERAGIASGLSEASTELGGAFGIALLGSLVASVYRGTLNEDSTGVLSLDTAHTLGGTLGELVQAAEQLPDGMAAGIVEAGRTAFVSGMQLSMVAAAGIALGAAILAIALLRNASTATPCPAQDHRKNRSRSAPR